MSTVLPAPAARRNDMARPLPSRAVPSDREVSRDLARRLKALSDPTRLQLLELVASRPGGRACICELTEPLGVTQPTVSHHMKLLAEAGLVSREQQGKWAYYTLRSEALAELADSLARLAGSSSRVVTGRAPTTGDGLACCQSSSCPPT